MNTIRIAIVDDHSLVRSGIRKLLEGNPDMRVVGEAGSAAEAMELVRASSPDVVLMDIALKADSGLEVTSALTQEFPQVRVLVLSMFATQAFVNQAVAAGAAGYLVKDRSPEQLEAAIRAIVNGSPFVGGVESGRSATSDPSSPLANLTQRQIEILRLVALGKSSREIGEDLYIAEKTVEHHRSNIRKVLGVPDIAGMILFAVRHGLVSPDEIPNPRPRAIEQDGFAEDKSS